MCFCDRSLCNAKMWEDVISALVHAVPVLSFGITIKRAFHKTIFNYPVVR